MADKAKKKARGNYCVAGAPIWLIVKIIRWLREFQCITSRTTKLYGRNGLCLSEFIGKISSHRSQRRYAQYTSTKSVSKAKLFRSRLPKLVRLFRRRGSWLKDLYLQDMRLFITALPSLLGSAEAEEQDVLQSTATSTTVTATRKSRRPGKCHTCGKPMLGHNAAECKSKKWKFGGQCVLCKIKKNDKS